MAMRLGGPERPPWSRPLPSTGEIDPAGAMEERAVVTPLTWACARSQRRANGYARTYPTEISVSFP